LLRRYLKQHKEKSGANLHPQQQQQHPAHGIGPENGHLYKARVGLFDVDYVGHMNNAAYLSHAEYARWEMGAESGMLQKMISDNIFFLAAGNFMRYRKELRPLFRSFVVETYISAIDDRNLWFSHNFRYSETDRILAEILFQSVVVKGGKVLHPGRFLVEECAYDKELIQSITWPDGANVSHADLLRNYRTLDDTMRAIAAEDDERHKNTA
jgi:acyl-CoA thioesterase FadM